MPNDIKRIQSAFYKPLAVLRYLLDDRLISLCVSVIFRCIYFSLYKVKIVANTNPALNWTEEYIEYIILSARYISVAMSYLLWAYVEYETFFLNLSSSCNFAFSDTVKPRRLANYVGRKISLLTPTQLVFIAIEQINPRRILQMHSFKRGINAILCFIPNIISCSLLFKSVIPLPFPWCPHNTCFEINHTSRANF